MYSIYHEEEEEDTCVSSCYTRALTWCIVGMYTRALTWDFFFTTGKDDENDADEDVEEDEVTGSRHTFSKKNSKKKSQISVTLESKCTRTLTFHNLWWRGGSDVDMGGEDDEEEGEEEEGDEDDDDEEEEEDDDDEEEE